MRVIGLTGSIGMGKSTVAAQLRCLGARVCSADAIVHELMAKGGKAVGRIEKLFPSAVKHGVVDRLLLGEAVFKNKAKLKQLEQQLHPLVIAEENRIIRKERRMGTRIMVLDIPLLYETGGEERCDAVIAASAPAFLQRRRVMQRRGMTEEKFRHILAAQLSDRGKRRRADAVILTGLGKAHSFRQLAFILRDAKRLRRICRNEGGSCAVPAALTGYDHAA